MATEDLTTYTENDPDSDLTVTTDKVDVSSCESQSGAYLRKDKGIDHFDALDIDFESYMGSVSAYGHIPVVGFSVTTTTPPITDLVVSHRNTTVPVFYFRRNGWGAYDTSGAISTNTSYYLTLSRSAGGDTVTCYIYTDADRTSLFDTLSVSGFGTTKWRYIFPWSAEGTASDTTSWTGFVENIDLNESAGPTYTVSVSATASVSSGLAREVKLTESIASSAVVEMTRKVGKNLAATATASASIARKVSLALDAAASVTVGITRKVSLSAAVVAAVVAAVPLPSEAIPIAVGVVAAVVVGVSLKVRRDIGATGTGTAGRICDRGHDAAS